MKVKVDFTARFLSSTVYLVVVVSGKIKTNEDYDFDALQSVFILSFTILYETVYFTTLKSKAKLFLRAETNKLQERQLENLLDTLPDKVMICEN